MVEETDQKRWREISPHLDAVLELEEGSREAYLQKLEASEPAVAAAVRVLLADASRLKDQPLPDTKVVAALSPAPSLAGVRLGAYTLESPLGQGGMGTVWLAHRSDGRFEGLAAVKLLNAALLGRPSEQRFVREGSLLAKLSHPHISQLTDAGVAPGGQPFLVLEYVKGERIDQYCESRSLTIEARVRLFLDVLSAVAHAHSHLVVHRDIKPSNILVTAEGTVKLLDFGVAALLHPEGESAAVTREAEPGFTPEYAAPEQLLGEPVSTATDVYALGLVLFVLLAGRYPQISRATLDREPRHPSKLVMDPELGRLLRGDLDNIVARALARDPAERYSSAEGFAQDLRHFLAHEPVSARPASWSYLAGRFLRRHRGAVATGAGMLLLLIGAIVIATQQMYAARKQRDAALYETKRAEFQARFAFHILSDLGDDGQPLTVKELMDRGVDVLEKNYRDDPRFVRSMLLTLSKRYREAGDLAGERAALDRAAQIEAQLGRPTPRD
jgi:hypothetical protein